MTHMYFSARAEGRISYGHLGRTNSCCFCFDSFSRLFLVLSCTMCGMCRRPIHIAQQVKSFLSASMLLSVNLTFPSNTCRGGGECFGAIQLVCFTGTIFNGQSVQSESSGWLFKSQLAGGGSIFCLPHNRLHSLLTF